MSDSRPPLPGLCDIPKCPTCGKPPKGAAGVPSRLLCACPVARTHKYRCPLCREWVYDDVTGRRNAFDGTAHTDPLWLNAVMTCAVCSLEWVATYPDDAPALECPACSHMNAIPQRDR